MRRPSPAAIIEHEEGTAASVILNVLAEGPRPKRDLHEAAKDAGVSPRTLERARAKLKVESIGPGATAEGWPSPDERGKTWWIRLPPVPSSPARGLGQLDREAPLRHSATPTHVAEWGGNAWGKWSPMCSPTRLDTLASLLDKSLLRQSEGAEGEPRYFMLETIREYAEERLQQSGDGEPVRGRHAALPAPRRKRSRERSGRRAAQVVAELCRRSARARVEQPASRRCSRV